MKKNSIKTMLTGLLLTGATLGYSPNGGLRLTIAEVQAKHETEDWKGEDPEGIKPAKANGSSQMPTDSDYNCWDWEDQSQANWKKKIGSNWEEIVSPPFSPSAEKSHLMLMIDRKEDYKKAQGWELVWANFQTEHPYFILYNRHRSIARVFFYLDGEISYSHIMVTLSFVDSNNPAILSAGKGLPADTYKPNNSSAGDDDMISVMIPLARKHWGAAEFPIVYDPNIRNYHDNLWVFNVYGINESSIQLTGVSGTNPNILDIKGEQYTMLSPKSAVSNNQFLGDYAKVHKQIKDINGFLDEMKKYAANIDSTKSSFLKDFKDVLTNVSSSASSWGSAIAGVSSTVSAALGFVNLVSGIFSKSTPPTATIQYINLQGKITSIVLLQPIPLTIPGISDGYYRANDWAFTCPMGIINLKTTPTIKKTTPYNRYGNDDKKVVIEKEHNNGLFIPHSDYFNINHNVHFHKLPKRFLSAASDATEWHPKSSWGSGYRGRLVQYQFDDEITLATQTIDGLTLQDIQVAIVCKPTGTTSSFKYNIYDKNLIYHEFYYGSNSMIYNINTTRIPLENPVYKALMDGRFVIHKFDEGDANNDGDDEIYFGTPFMDRNQLKGTVFEVPEHTEVKLVVYARFSSDQYEEPVIFKSMYDLKPVIEQAKLANCPNNPIYPNYCDVNTVYFWQEIANFGFSDYCKNYVTPELPAVRNLETDNTNFDCNRLDNCPPF